MIKWSAVSLKDSVKDRSLARFESVVMLELLTTKATKVELVKDNKYLPRKNYSSMHL